MKRKIPVIELFVLLFGLLLLNGSNLFNTFYDFKSMSWFDSKYGNEKIVPLLSIEDIEKNDIKAGIRVSIDSTIVSTRDEGNSFTIIGLAELGDNINTTIKLKTPDYAAFTTLSKTSTKVKLEILLDNVEINESVINLAFFEEDYIPVHQTDLLLTGKLTNFTLL